LNSRFWISAIVFLLGCNALPEHAVHAADAVQADASSLLVQISRPAKMIGFPAVCPGSSPEDKQDELICLAELYEAKVRVLRHLGGPETARYLTIRFTAHSFHAVWRKNVRFLLVVTPFEDKGNRGHFASYWDWENEQRKFCKATNDIADWNAVPMKALFAAGKRRITDADDEDWSENIEILCVTGYERMSSDG
jgi:hypothetical protein